MCSALLFLLISAVISSRISAAIDEDMDTTRKITDVVAVLGGNARLPCDMRVPMVGDRVKLLLWYCGSGGKAFYTYDTRRGQGITDGTHWWSKNVDKSRLNLQIAGSHATLAISGVTAQDQSVYRCRVDFLHSPTRNSRVNLTIVVPAGKPVIYESDGNIVEGRTSPVREGRTATFTCNASLGWPPANLTWWKQSSLVDSSWSRDKTGQRVTNQLTVGPVTRHDLGTQYTCSASNHVLSPPRTSSIIIDMLLAPILVKIEDPPGPVSAGVILKLTCHCVGSRPAAHISWWLDDRQLLGAKESVLDGGNKTVSSLSLTPDIEHAGTTVQCRAVNPRLRNQVLTDSLVLHVLYRPVVKLSIWSTSRQHGVVEGDNVYLKCHVQADPPHKSVEWFKESRPISQFDELRNAELKEDVMVLRHVNSAVSGHYSCRAANSHGSGNSKQQELKVTGVPQCDSRESVLHVARSEQINITCQVRSIPPPHRYTWTLNNSVGVNIVSTSDTAVISYTPESVSDYGVLQCKAENSLGTQQKSCIFNIIMIEQPSKPVKCRLTNVTRSSVVVTCQPGVNGGLNQTFIAEVTVIRSSRDRTSTVPPTITTPSVYHSRTARLVLDNLTPDQNYTIKIYAQNSKGKSEMVTMNATTLQEDAVEPLRFLASVFRVTPLLGILIGVAGTFTLLVLTICVTMRLRVRRDAARKPRPVAHHITRSSCSHVTDDVVGERTHRNTFDSLTDPVERDMAERLVGRTSFEDDEHPHHHHHHHILPSNIKGTANINHYPPAAIYTNGGSLRFPNKNNNIHNNNNNLINNTCPVNTRGRHLSPVCVNDTSDTSGDTHGDISETLSNVGETAPLMNSTSVGEAPPRESSV